LAGHLCCTVRELENRLSGKELSEWMAFERVEPFGVQMDNFRAGQICAAIVNCNGGKNGKAVSASDFIPLFTQESPVNDKRRAQKKQIAMFSQLAGKPTS